MSGDLISRQDAVSRMSDLLMMELKGQRLPTWNEVYQAMNDVPTAEPEREKGHWIDTDNYYQRWKCSNCGCHTRDAEPNYCPHCGTKMEGESQWMV